MTLSAKLFPIPQLDRTICVFIGQASKPTSSLTRNLVRVFKRLANNTHTHTHTYTYTHTHTHAHTWRHTHSHIYGDTHTQSYMDPHSHIYGQTHTHTLRKEPC